MKPITIFLTFVISTVFSIQLESTQPKLDATNCPANCTQCDSDNKCTKCQDTYQIVNDGCQCPDKTLIIQSKCVSCDITDCTQCSSYNFCSQCSGSLKVNTQGNSCIDCDNTNCMLCSSTNVCQTCMPGYQLSSTGQCFNCSDFTGCKSCSDNNVCQQCIPGFSKVDNKCVLCQEPCISCSATNVCKQCDFHYSFSPDINGVCFTCNISNCHQCSSINVCQQCENLYSLTSDNKCVLSCANTQYCASCTSGTCNSCISGYTLSSNNSCLKCSGAPACKVCSPTNVSSCTQCLPGFYLSSSNQCIQCPYENCATCNSSVCLSLKSSTFQRPFTNNPSNILYSVFCNAECQSCSMNNPEFCYQCRLGYSLMNGNCYPCDKNCASCSVSAPQVCLSCYQNGYISNGTCNTCNSSSNCLTCSSTNTTQCLSCNYGYFIAENGTCQNGCQQNCLICQTANSSICKSCKSGYVIAENGDCVPCYPNCRVCSSVDPKLCVDCGPGFFLNATFQCSACGQFCISCTPMGCLTCIPGYFLNSTSQCTQICNLPCATCNPANTTQCYSCIGGYTFQEKDNSCLNKTSNCPGGICTLCPFGYTLNGISCLECKGNCSRCDITNTSKCTSCLFGHYLKDNKCFMCPEGCTGCINNETCILCNPGYTLELPNILFGNQVCQRCQYPCKTCSLNQDTCTSCVQGYSINGWSCLANFNFGIQIRLNANISTFYQNYYAFLLNLASSMQTNDIDIVSVYSITQNILNQTFDNIDILCNVSSLAQSGTGAAAVVQKNIQVFFQQTSTLGGMKVLLYQIQTNNGNITTTTNYGLILGLSIPLGFLFIAGLLYFFCSHDDRKQAIRYNQVGNQQDTKRVTYELKESF